MANTPINVLGSTLKSCGTKPMTGYLRDGFCGACGGDQGLHLVCASVTKEFLEFSLARGNDLMTPRPEFSFPGLVDGTRWCLCCLRWLEAYEAGFAPPVFLEGTHISALEYIDLEVLREHAIESLE